MWGLGTAELLIIFWFLAVPISAFGGVVYFARKRKRDLD